MLFIDLSLADTADTIDQSLTDRAKRQVRLTCVCFLDPGQVVTINNVEENRAGRYVELVDWKWPTSKGELYCHSYVFQFLSWTIRDM